MIDIIVVTYNAKDKLKRCLDSIEQYTRGIEYLLTVVNNNSSDGTFPFLKQYQQKKKVRIMNNNKNLGFAGGANVALRNTVNKFIAFLDDDAEVTEGWLEKLYKQIKGRPRIGIVGGKIVLPNNRIFAADYWAKPLYIVGVGEIDRGQRNYVKECDALIGTCWLMRRELVDEVGYFDERFFPSQHEDADYCLRTRLAGYKIIYDGKIKIIHHHIFRDGKQFRKNRRKFLKKWKNVLDKFPLKDSHPVNKHMAYGYDDLKKSRYKEALAKLEKVESFDKRFSDPVFLCKGLAFEKLRNFEEAINEFKKMIDINPLHLEAHSALVLIYKKIGWIKGRKREAAKVIDIISHKKFCHKRLIDKYEL